MSSDAALSVLLHPDSTVTSGLDQIIETCDVNMLQRSIDTMRRFQTACVFLSHSDPAILNQGRALMETVVNELEVNVQGGVSSDNDRLMYRDALFFLAVGLTKLNERAYAQRIVEKMLSLPEGRST